MKIENFEEITEEGKLKLLLHENSIVKTIKSLDVEMNEISSEFEDNSIEFSSELNNEYELPILALTKMNIDLIKNERKNLTRFNYNFPALLNIGSLREYSEVPSKILNDKHYVSEIPYYIPIANSSVGFFVNDKHREQINSNIEMIGLKLISTIPTGLSKISIIDKNGAGQNFPTLLTLHDKIKGQNVLSNDKEIENKLLDLKNSVSKISSSVTASGFSSIEDFNKNTKEIPQSYNFLFIANFPNGFTKKSAESLISLLESGHTAGIYVFMTFAVDPKFGINNLVSNIQLSEYIKNITLFEVSNKQTHYEKFGFNEPNISLFASPLKMEEELKTFTNTSYKMIFEKRYGEVVSALVEELNNDIKDRNLRPIIDIMNTIPKQMWTGDSSKGVSAQFAKNGIENINFSIGINASGEDENAHHGFIMGTTGSGKTNVLNNLILHLSMKYSPKDLQFWLLDYKEGTEFAIYKDFPYVQILSMESEIEFGQDVLSKAISLIEQRAILFKGKGASNLSNYNLSVPSEERLTRIVILIDEFQHLFSKKGNISNISNERINDILRRGRSFGVNLFLSTQTLKDVDIDSQLLSNMPLRIGLKMDSKDAAKIFGEENDALNYISDPGEGIYNNSYGNSVYNVRFQAYLAEKDSINKIIEILKDKISNEYDLSYINKLYLDRNVYNGESDGSFKNNKVPYEDIENGIYNENRIYIGEPAGLNKTHPYINFKNDFGENLLICGADIYKAYSLFHYIIKQIDQSKNDIYITNSHNASAKPLEDSLISSKNYFDNSNAELIIDRIHNIMEERKEIAMKDKTAEFKSIYFFNFFIDNSKVFKVDSYMKDSYLSKVKKIINEGSQIGIHTIMFSTNYSSLINSTLTSDLDRFKKKICLKEGNSLKILGDNIYGVSFSKSKHVSILSTGEISEPPIKFKPYNALEEKQISEVN